jgi:hypothetical protein
MMERTTSLTLTLLLTVALTVAGSGFESRRNAELSLAALSGEQAALAARIRAAEAKLASGERQQAEMQTVLQGLPAPQPASPSSGVSTEKIPDEATVLAHNPELSALQAKSFRAGLTARYGLIYQALGLTPDQIERINDLLTRGKQEEMKLIAAAGSQGLDRSAPEVQALLQQVRARYASEDGAIVGDATNRQFEHLVGTLPLADHVTNMVSLLASSSTPFTSSQGIQVLQILENTSSLDPATMQADPSTIRWEEAFQQAQGILSAPQLAAMKADFQLSELVRLKKEFYQRPALAN